MIDLINFHSFFPGGYRRELVESGRSPCAEWGKIVVDLGSLLVGFNPSDLIRERRLWYQKVRKVVEITKRNPRISVEEIESLDIESEEHCRRVQEMIYPFYEKMLDLGYSSNDLIR